MVKLSVFWYIYSHLCPVKVYAAHFCKLVCTLGFPDLLTSRKNQELNVGSGSRFWLCVTKDCNEWRSWFWSKHGFLWHSLFMYTQTWVNPNLHFLWVVEGLEPNMHKKMNLFKNRAVMLDQEKRVAGYPTHKLRWKCLLLIFGCDDHITFPVVGVYLQQIRLGPSYPRGLG